jgi:TPR repeat protein
MHHGKMTMNWIMTLLLGVCTATAATNDFRQQYELAHRYKNGWGVTNDMQKALALFTKAANGGHPKAQLWLGCMYAGGFVPKDLDKAKQWWRTAAERGDVDAQRTLGQFFANDFYGPPDFKSAFQWLSRAANQGDAHAQTELSHMYLKGQGVPQFDLAGYTWLLVGISTGGSNNLQMLPVAIMPESEIKGALSGDEAMRIARTKLKQIWELNLTPAQIAEAKRRAVAFRPKLEPLR